MTERNIQTWGPKWWHTLHLMSFTYPMHPTAEDKNTYTTAINSILQVLPCMDCRIHSINYIRHNPPNVKSRSSLSKWMVAFHNHVNHRLGKPTVPYSIAVQLYMQSDTSIKPRSQNIQKCLPWIITSCTLIVTCIIIILVHCIVAIK